MVFLKTWSCIVISLRHFLKYLCYLHMNILEKQTSFEDNSEKMTNSPLVSIKCSLILISNSKSFMILLGGRELQSLHPIGDMESMRTEFTVLSLVVRDGITLSIRLTLTNYGHLWAHICRRGQMALSIKCDLKQFENMVSSWREHMFPFTPGW